MDLAKRCDESPGGSKEQSSKGVLTLYCVTILEAPSHFFVALAKWVSLILTRTDETMDITDALWKEHIEAKGKLWERSERLKGPGGNECAQNP